MGCLITLEGGEGAGKSTLQKKLAESLDYEVVTTREPGGTELGVGIRSLILGSSENPPSPITELLLFAADRAEHVQKVIKPALKDNAVVICDRFIHSTIAYQGFGRGIDIETLENLNLFATYGTTPDIVLLVDVDVEIGLKRARAREESESWNRFEDSELEFHQRVREGFLKLSEDSSNKIRVIDGNQSEEEVFKQAKLILDEFFG